MEEILYSVIDTNDGPEKVIAKDMTLDNATILLKALFNEYFREQGLSYMIVRQLPDAVVDVNEG
jgi:hypothetical protein